MSGAAWVFYGVQALCVPVALLLAYGHAYRRRLDGHSGQVIEREMARIAPLFAGSVSFLTFLAFPDSAGPWYRLPPFHWIAELLLGADPGADSNAMLVKFFLALVLSGTLAQVARGFTFSLNRRLVRSVPRFQAARKP